MTGILMAAIITITLALVFYTIGVWSEHRSKQLKKIHLIDLFDTTYDLKKPSDIFLVWTLHGYNRYYFNGTDCRAAYVFR